MIKNVICLVALVIAGCHPAAEDKPAPERKPAWGVVVDGYPVRVEMLESIKKDTSVDPSYIVFFLQWPMQAKEDSQPGGLEESLGVIDASGCVPCLTWEPMYMVENKEYMITVDQILGGQYDSYIENTANIIKHYDDVVMIRFAHEMNLSRYHWGTDAAGYGETSPDIYKKMFRYLVRKFKAMGVANVRWVFCANAESVPMPAQSRENAWNTIRNYYPGDEYVDILGIDGYNWGTLMTYEDNGWQSKWMSFEDIFSPAIVEMKALSDDKDILIFETASTDRGGSRTRWIKDMFETLYRWDVSGIAWFQANKEADWRLKVEKGRLFSVIINDRTSNKLELLEARND